ncbi:hypothetical protein [Streptomyces sp. CA-256286]|uniref:hypothetical protein n=1 Tax=Streptomyces sp. CA-256286 TaxID=2801033 RepID=UPI001A999924|nr:hypothetical protein [Streptomyces sp. CA-256286]QTA36717.1 hypothetical protein JHY03_69330 [Streptomyces sp. CA-256286]
MVELLFRSAASDGGRRLSLHLADDEKRNQVMLLALSHRQDMPPGDDNQVLRDTEHMRTLPPSDPATSASRPHPTDAAGGRGSTFRDPAQPVSWRSGLRGQLSAVP